MIIDHSCTIINSNILHTTLMIKAYKKTSSTEDDKKPCELGMDGRVYSLVSGDNPNTSSWHILLTYTRTRFKDIPHGKLDLHLINSNTLHTTLMI